MKLSIKAKSKGGHDVIPAKAGIQKTAASELRACFIYTRGSREPKMPVKAPS